MWRSTLRAKFSWTNTSWSHWSSSRSKSRVRTSRLISAPQKTSISTTISLLSRRQHPSNPYSETKNRLEKLKANPLRSLAWASSILIRSRLNNRTSLNMSNNVASLVGNQVLCRTHRKTKTRSCWTSQCSTTNCSHNRNHKWCCRSETRNKTS